MDSVLAMHRFHFAFTVTFHYLFAQLSMGLALLIFILKTMALRTGSDHYHRAARFWISASKQGGRNGNVAPQREGPRPTWPLPDVEV